MTRRTAEDVDDTMAEIQEQMDVANEINSAIASPLSGVDIFDDEVSWPGLCLAPN